MKRNICNICGGNLINKNGRWVCEACGAFAPEEITNEEITLLYNASQKLRVGDFDDAEEMYSDIVREYPNNSDAYWGLALSQYGIKYEKDYDGKMIPTCFNTSYESLLNNSNYIKAYELANKEQKEYLKKQAQKIEVVRKEWIEIASKEEPYDIFLSYKATEIDDESIKTEDSFEAHEIYNELVKLGYRVFFSKEALSDKTGEHYEPYIFNALNTCHVMIVYASKPEYVNSTWVRNEWLRYYKRIKNKEKLDNSLVLIYKNFNPSVLSRPLSNRQNFDRNDIRFGDKLEAYLNRVVAEAKKVIPHIDPITLKPFEANNKKVETINKRKLGVLRVDNKVENIEIQTRDIGSFSSPKLTSKAEDQLNLGFIYLKKKMFEDSLACFDSILVNNKTNSQALLGKLLSNSHCVDLSEFYNFDFRNFNDFDLLKKVIDYSNKKDGEAILSELLNKVFDYIERYEWVPAKNIYLQICDYNTTRIQNNHSNVIKKIINSNQFNKDSLSLIDCAFKFLLSNKEEYSYNICNLIISLIKNCKIEEAKKYYECASVKCMDINLVDAKICLETKKYQLDEAILAFINTRKYTEFDSLIASLSEENANHLLCGFSNAILNNFNSLDKVNRNDYSKLLVEYDFSFNDEFVKSLIKIILINPCEENNDVFDVLLTTFNNKNIDKLVNIIAEYSSNFIKIGDFLFAKKYIDLALSYDQTNIELLKKKLIISIGSKHEKDIWKDIYKINDYSIIERILSCTKSEEEMVDEISFLCEQCILYIGNTKTNINKNIFNVFDRLVRYYPESYNNSLLSLIQRISDICKDLSLFENAEKYYSMMTGLDSTEHKAFWGLLQSKLKCRNNNELIHQNVLISSVPEFNNAIIAAGSNSEAVEQYIDCRTKQEIWIKNTEKKKANKKKATIVGSIVLSLLVAFVAIFSLSKNVIIPNTKYNNAVSLLNNGNYEEAYNEFIKLDYKDSSSQILVAKAGMAFESGDYETGIQNIYDAGGTVNILYDGNGGNVPKSGETIKRLKSFVNNDPTLYGYDFYGWVIDTFTISSQYNDYLCDLNLKATWEIINYSISYNLNGGTLSGLTSTYNCKSEDIVLGYPDKKGYTFIGWTGTGIDTLKKDVIIPSGSIGNRSFEAHFDANDYTVTYDYGYGDKTSTDTVTYGSQFNLETPERTGYLFKGWYYNGSLFNNGLWDKDEDVTLTASWEAITYSIIYDYNGGNSVENPQQYTIETSTFTLNNPSKKGYTFIGWSGTDIEGLSTSVSVIKGSIGNRQFSAHYSANNYTITYDYGYDSKTSTATVTYDSQFILESPSRDGYEFSGWLYNGKPISSGNWIIDSDVTLLATWSIKEYSISYNLNGGSNSSANLKTYTIETPSFTLADPNKDGYDFIGWTGTNISNITKAVTIEKGSIGNRTYTANWKAHTYTVSFDPKGGDCEISSLSIDYGNELSLPIATRTGYTFAGWYTVEGDLLITDCTWNYLSDLNLYAKWNLNTYTISYSLNGGTNNDDNPISYTFESSEITIKNPSREGYTFIGWDSVIGTSMIEPKISSGSSGDISFSANWEANLNTIIFNGNTNTSGEMSSIQVYTDGNTKLTKNLFVKTGYHFIGWSLSSNGNVDYLDESIYYAGPEAIINLYAIWEANLNTITFHGNGSDGGEMENQTIRTDSSESLRSNEFSKTGYHFVGWSTTNDGDVEFIDNESYLMGSNNNYDLFAIWEPNEYTISYNTNGGSITVNNKDVVYDSQFELDVPSREGYVFVGWYLGDDQITDATGSSLTEYAIAGDITVVAHWSANLNVVLLNVDGETTKTYGNTDSKIRLPKNEIIKENHLFLGWAETSNGNVIYKDEDLYLVGPKSSYTLYGVWKDVSDYTPIYNYEDLINIKANGKYYLANDIDCSAIEWTPLFDYSTEFSGEIYGNNHSIYNVRMSNFTISKYYKNEPVKNYYPSTGVTYVHNRYYAYTGLICKIGTNGIIDGVNLYATLSGEFTGLSVYSAYSDCTGYGYYYFGGICGLNSGTITNCSCSLNFDNLKIKGTIGSMGTTSSTAYFTSIAGKNDGLINNCFGNFSGSSITTTGISRLYYYSITSSGSTDCFYNTNNFGGSVSNSGGSKEIMMAGKTPILVMDSDNLIDIFWIDNKQPFKLSLIYNPVKFGYTLTGWEYNGQTYSLDEYIYPNDEQEIIIRPVFEANDVVVNLFSNNDIDEENSTIIVKTGQEYSLSGLDNGLTNPYGYHFAGWSSSPSGTVEYGATDDFISDGNSINLYAIWSPNKNTIVFHSNGGSGNMDSQYIYTDETISINSCSFTAPQGYYFAGWSSSPNGAVEYLDCSNITSNGTSLINLYAIWLEI